MKLPLFYFLLPCLWTCFSCSPYPQEVCHALKLADGNVSELEKVLEYYRGRDAQKYEAACFLIANMPYNSSRREITLSGLHESYFAAADSLFQLYFGEMSAAQIKKKKFRIPDSVRNMLAARYARIPLPAYAEGKKDIECITSDFLVDNIESAFDVWHSSPLAETPRPDWQVISIDTQRNYRYLSIHSCNRRPLHLAEIRLSGFSGGAVSTSSSALPLEVYADTLYRNVVDGNVETFVNTPAVHLRLKYPANIKEIRFIPRNSNNAVNEGDTYTLYYFCKGEWIVFATQKADHNFVNFCNVPAGGLYLLKDINSGKEELPFTYSKGEQHWIFDASSIRQ